MPNGHAATPRRRPRNNDFLYSRAVLLRSYDTPLSTPSRQSTNSDAFPIRRFGMPAAKFTMTPASSSCSSSSSSEAFREVRLHHVAHAADAGDEGPDRQGQPGQVQEGSQDHQLRQGGHHRPRRPGGRHQSREGEARFLLSRFRLSIVVIDHQVPATSQAYVAIYRTALVLFVNATTVMMVVSPSVEPSSCGCIYPPKVFFLAHFFFVSRHGAFHAVFFLLPRFFIFFPSYFFIVFDVDAILSCCPFFSIISRTKVVSCGFFALVCYHKTRWPERRLTYIRASRLRPS